MLGSKCFDEPACARRNRCQPWPSTERPSLSRPSCAEPRSLAISQELLGTQEVAIIHHTDCGMLTFTDAALRERLRKSRKADADAIAFLPFGDLDQSVRDDLAAYAASPLVRHDIPVRGFVYDVKSGRLREVTPRG